MSRPAPFDGPKWEGWVNRDIEDGGLIPLIQEAKQ